MSMYHVPDLRDLRDLRVLDLFRLMQPPTGAKVGERVMAEGELSLHDASDASDASDA